MDLQDIIWICGFYEGEGTISNDISNNNSIRLCIYQNENCFIEYQKVYHYTYLETSDHLQSSLL